MATDPDTKRVVSSGAPRELSRTALWLSALALLATLVAGVAIVALTADEGPRPDTKGQLTEDRGAKPHIIPRPGEGRAPQDPGDRGGWEQLALLGLLGTAMTGIGVVIFRGGRRTRANRARWLAAAASGQDGALSDRRPVAPDQPPSARP